MAIAPRIIFKIACGWGAILAYFHAIVNYYIVTYSWLTNNTEDAIKYYCTIFV